MVVAVEGKRPSGLEDVCQYFLASVLRLSPPKFVVPGRADGVRDAGGRDPAHLGATRNMQDALGGVEIRDETVVGRPDFEVSPTPAPVTVLRPDRRSTRAA